MEFDPTAPAFLADPYPVLAELRETTAVLRHEELDRWFVTRHADVRACLRDRRLGRNYRHVGTDEEFHAEPLDARWNAFWDVERWSLLWLEPPDHTRIRKLVASAFTPRTVEAMREPAARLARELLEPLASRGRMDLLYDFAQPYSIGLICAWLGVPGDRQRDLLDWSHAMVKMYELETSEEQAVAANAAAAAFRDYTLELIAERRQAPRDDLVSGLVRGARRRWAPERRGDRLDRDRPPRCRARGDGEHARKRRACAHGTSSAVGAPRRRLRLTGCRDRGASAVRPATPALRALGARGRRRGCRRSDSSRREDLGALRFCQPRPSRVHGSGRLRRWTVERRRPHQLRRWHPRLHRRCARAYRARGEPACARRALPRARAHCRAEAHTLRS